MKLHILYSSPELGNARMNHIGDTPALIEATSDKFIGDILGHPKYDPALHRVVRYKIPFTWSEGTALMENSIVGAWGTLPESAYLRDWEGKKIAVRDVAPNSPTYANRPREAHFLLNPTDQMTWLYAHEERRRLMDLGFRGVRYDETIHAWWPLGLTRIWADFFRFLRHPPPGSPVREFLQIPSIYRPWEHREIVEACGWCYSEDFPSGVSMMPKWPGSSPPAKFLRDDGNNWHIGTTASQNERTARFMREKLPGVEYVSDTHQWHAARWLDGWFNFDKLRDPATGRLPMWG